MTQREEQQAKRIQQLLQENAELRDRLQMMEDALSDCVPDFFKVHFTVSELALLGMFAKTKLVRKESAMTMLYGHKNETAMDKIIDVFICKLRKKLKPHGIEIQNVFGQGYMMPPASKEALNKLREVA